MLFNKKKEKEKDTKKSTSYPLLVLMVDDITSETYQLDHLRNCPVGIIWREGNITYILSAVAVRCGSMVDLSLVLNRLDVDTSTHVTDVHWYNLHNQEIRYADVTYLLREHQIIPNFNYETRAVRIFMSSVYKWWECRFSTKPSYESIFDIDPSRWLSEKRGCSIMMVDEKFEMLPTTNAAYCTSEEIAAVFDGRSITSPDLWLGLLRVHANENAVRYKAKIAIQSVAVSGEKPTPEDNIYAPLALFIEFPQTTSLLLEATVTNKEHVFILHLNFGTSIEYMYHIIVEPFNFFNDSFTNMIDDIIADAYITSKNLPSIKDILRSEAGRLFINSIFSAAAKYPNQYAINITTTHPGVIALVDGQYNLYDFSIPLVDIPSHLQAEIAGIFVSLGNEMRPVRYLLTFNNESSDDSEQDSTEEAQGIAITPNHKPKYYTRADLVATDKLYQFLRTRRGINTTERRDILSLALRILIKTGESDEVTGVLIYPIIPVESMGEPGTVRLDVYKISNMEVSPTDTRVQVRTQYNTVVDIRTLIMHILNTTIDIDNTKVMLNLQCTARPVIDAFIGSLFSCLYCTGGKDFSDSDNLYILNSSTIKEDGGVDLLLVGEKDSNAIIGNTVLSERFDPVANKFYTALGDNTPWPDLVMEPIIFPDELERR